MLHTRLRPRLLPTLVALVLAASAAPTARAEDPPLRDGEDILLLRPRRTHKIGHQSVAFAFDRQLRGEAVQPAVQELLHAAPFARAVRDWQRLRIRGGFAPAPLAVVLREDLEGVSYTTLQPIIVFTKGSRRPTSVRLDTAVHLSRRTLEGLAAAWDRRKTGGGPRWNRAHETLCHETGHAIMLAAYFHPKDLDLTPERWARLLGWGLSPENGLAALTGEGHYYKKQTDPAFAWSEGFAEYCGAHYTGRRVRFDPTGLTPDEIRRTEGAQAQLLLSVSRALGPGAEEGHRALLRTMARHRPPSFVDLVLDLTRQNPGRRDAVDQALQRATRGRYHLPGSYSLERYAQDFRPNAERLWRAVLERAGVREPASKKRKRKPDLF